MNSGKPQAQNSSFKHAILQWLGIGAAAAVLYFSGLHTEVLGTMQRALLWTGFFDANAEEVTTTDGPFLSEDAYSFTLPTPKGQQLTLQDFKGKVLFINIWASWCPPCVAEMPTIERLYEHVMNNEDIKFLLISLDEDVDKAINFMEDKALPMPYYFPASEIPPFFQSPYIPATYVVSKEGQIIYKKEGIANYSSPEFRDWLDELSK